MTGPLPFRDGVLHHLPLGARAPWTVSRADLVLPAELLEARAVLLGDAPHLALGQRDRTDLLAMPGWTPAEASILAARLTRRAVACCAGPQEAWVGLGSSEVRITRTTLVVTEHRGRFRSPRRRTFALVHVRIDASGTGLVLDDGVTRAEVPCEVPAATAALLRRERERLRPRRGT